MGLNVGAKVVGVLVVLNRGLRVVVVVVVVVAGKLKGLTVVAGGAGGGRGLVDEVKGGRGVVNELKVTGGKVGLKVVENGVLGLAVVMTGILKMDGVGGRVMRIGALVGSEGRVAEGRRGVGVRSDGGKVGKLGKVCTPGKDKSVVGNLNCVNVVLGGWAVVVIAGGCLVDVVVGGRLDGREVVNCGCDGTVVRFLGEKTSPVGTFGMADDDGFLDLSGDFVTGRASIVLNCLGESKMAKL